MNSHIEEPYEGPPSSLNPEDYPLDPIPNLGFSINHYHNPSKIAVIDCSNQEERQFTFTDISNLSNAVALGLTKVGIGQGDRVAILAKNCTEFLVTLYGIFRLGAVAVPLNYKMSAADIKFMLADSKAKLVFCDSSTAHLLGSDLPVVNYNISFKNFLITGDSVRTIPYEQIQDALVLYTAGTTGHPKGVVISHQNHLWAIARHRRKDRVWGIRRISLMSAPMYQMFPMFL